MIDSKRLQQCLLILRVTVFAVMFMWTVDKFVRPEHATKVYETFYALGGLEHATMYTIGGIEVVVLLAFVAGLARQYTYGAVLLFHTVSTLSSYKQYFDPFHGPNLLFFAAWPMLAACFTLYGLRDADTMCSCGPQ